MHKGIQIGLVLQFLEEELEVMESDLCHLPMCKKQAERHLWRLVRFGVAHITRWEMWSGEGRLYPRPVFRFGPGLNKPKPKAKPRSQQKHTVLAVSPANNQVV